MNLKKLTGVVFAALALMASAAPAFATADIASTDVTTALTNVIPDATVILQAVLPLVGGVIALVICVKLFKRFARAI